MENEKEEEKENQDSHSAVVDDADKKYDLGKTPISTIMSITVATISETSNIKIAMQIMVNQKISGLPVVDDADHVIGILSEKDLLLSAASKHLNAPINFTKSPDCATPDTTLKDALMKMLMNNRKWLPVVDNNQKPVGIIARRDLLRVFLSNEKKGS